VPVHLLHLDFVVRQRCQRHRVPVHEALAAIDQPVLEQAEERLAHGFRALLVHRESQAVPVARAAHGLELGDDLLLVLVLPGLDLGDEDLALELRPPLAFFLHHTLLDHRLRRDPGVVGAGEPAGVVAGHPAPAGEDVLDRVVQGVAEVKRRGDVRRGDDDGERIAGVGGFGMEGAFAQPHLVRLALDGGGVVGLGQVARHGGRG
jgi:hypothetical protein